MPPQNSNPPSGKIEMFKLKNTLKSRAGGDPKQEEGFLAPEMIEEADKLITSLCVDCPKTTATHLEELCVLWAKMQAADNANDRYNLSVLIFTLAHEIKDVGSMCGYALLSYFAESLRDYIGQTEMNIQAQVVIIQAHIDAMQIVHRQGVKSDAGPEAEELKKMVKKAIDKYK